MLYYRKGEQMVTSVNVESSYELSAAYLKNKYYNLLLEYLSRTNQADGVKHVMFFGQYADVMYNDHSWIDVSYKTLEKYLES
jgi:hypothetical protein